LSYSLVSQCYQSLCIHISFGKVDFQQSESNWIFKQGWQLLVSGTLMILGASNTSEPLSRAHHELCRRRSHTLSFLTQSSNTKKSHLQYSGKWIQTWRASSVWAKCPQLLVRRQIMSTSIYCSDNVCVFMNYILCHTFYNASCFRARSEFIKVFKILLWLAVVFLPFRRSNSGNLVCA
jgi:hypothetical protein